MVQSAVYEQAIGTTAWNPIPRKEKDVVGTTKKFTLFCKDLPCTLRRLMMAALLRLPHLSHTIDPSVSFDMGRTQLRPCKSLPITVPAVTTGLFFCCGIDR